MTNSDHNPHYRQETSFVYGHRSKNYGSGNNIRSQNNHRRNNGKVQIQGFHELMILNKISAHLRAYNRTTGEGFLVQINLTGNPLWIERRYFSRRPVPISLLKKVIVLKMSN